MSANTNQERKNIWYKPVSREDYPKITEMGEVVIQVRFLPGVNENKQVYEAFFEKDVSKTKFPNTQKWLLPLLVVNDSLHPEKNGFVGVMECTKTLAKQIRGKNTPPNYFDINNGFNFNIVVSMQQSKDGSQYFPNYVKSHYEQSPKPINGKYVYEKMQEGDFVDFAQLVNRLNNPKPKSETQTYTPNNDFPTQQTSNVPSQPSGGGMAWEVPETAPQPSQPADNTNDISNEEFDSIFGTPNDEVPF